jgi:G:T/U-mismatch repair DNA glycosylase
MIAFNGGKAAAIGRRQLPDAAGIALIDLPSSSAAHTIGFDAKLAAWSQLREALGKS